MPKSVGQDPNIINGGQSVSSPAWQNFSMIKQLSGWIRDVSIWLQQLLWWWYSVKVTSPSHWFDRQSLSSSEHVSGDTRCFTRLKPSLTDSVMCGRGYSCVKISQPPPIFDLYGQFVAPERRGGYTTIFRGCFVLDMLMVRPNWLSGCRHLTLPSTYRTSVFSPRRGWSTVGAPPKISAINQISSRYITTSLYQYYLLSFYYDSVFKHK